MHYNMDTKLQAQILTSKVWGIHIKDSAIALLKNASLNEVQLEQILTELEALSEIIQIAFYTEMERVIKEEESFLTRRILDFIKDRPGLIQAKIVLESWQDTKSVLASLDQILLTKPAESIKEDALIMRFFFPKPLEKSWNHINSSNPSFKPRTIYEWGYFYRFLRTNIFWPFINSNDKLWFIRLNQKGHHIPNVFNYMFEIRN